MKIRLFLLFTAVCLCSNAQAEEKPETAWVEESRKDIAKSYVYGSVALPPDVFRLLSGYDHAPEDDPFSEDEPDANKLSHLKLNDIAPWVPPSRAPICLPMRGGFRDCSKLLKKNGLAFGDKEWALIPGGLDSHSHLYFCTTAENANIIDSLFNHRCCGPRNISQLSTLVSIHPNKLTNKAWTAQTISNHSPIVHARYGHQGRSGERVKTRFNTPEKKIASYTMEPTIGEHKLLADYRLDYSLKLAAPDLSIAQQTAITANINTPFVLDCGVHGKDARRYFILIHSRIVNQDEHRYNEHFIPVKKIEGKYAIQDQAAGKKQDAEPTYTTHRYSTDPSFLVHLRNKVDEYQYQDPKDPFEGKRLDKPRKGLSPPARVTPPKGFKHFEPNDKIFDITPHLNFLELYTYKGEWVYYNQTQNQLILHGGLGLHERVGHIVEGLNYTPRHVRITADIVLVDHKEFDHLERTIQLVKKSNPEYLAKYTATARSGEKGTAGIINLPATKDPKTGKEITSYTYDFEIEPTIGETNKTVDVRYSLRTKALGVHSLSIDSDSAVSIQDGEPLIIELGHPNSGTRTHLLILHADIITPDGSFYRDRFKPVE